MEVTNSAYGSGGARMRRDPTGIVVGVDGSPSSWAALDWAARASANRGGKLEILHALDMPMVGVLRGFIGRVPPPQEFADWAMQLLREAGDHVTHTSPGLELHTEISASDPAHALLAASRTAKMIVVGTRGLGSAASAFLGSVSVRVSAHASCPVVVVPDPEGKTGGEESRAKGSRKCVVVGLDGSSGAGAALRFALDEAARTGSELVAAHAWEVPLPIDVPVLDPASRAGARDFLIARADKYIRNLVEEARGEYTKNVPVKVEVVQDQAAHALLNKGNKAALMVVGSRGRGGFTGLLLGSVSQTVLHYTRVPVAVIRPSSQWSKG